MKNKLLLLTAISAATILQTCRDKDEKTKTKDDYLCTTSCWRPVSKIVDTTNDGIDNGTEQIAACDQDNCEVFYTNGTGNFNAGSNTCPGEITDSTIWSWANAEKTAFNYKRGNSPQLQYQILELNETTFRYTITFDNTAQGGEYKKLTLKAVH